MMNLKSDGAEFCEDFDDDMDFLAGYSAQQDYITGLADHAMANNGDTGA